MLLRASLLALLASGCAPEKPDPEEGVDTSAPGCAEQPWYADADADGFGDAAVVTVACDAPAGAVADATDCDDAAFGVNPGAAEVCDGQDDDCDGGVDEDAADAPTWYADEDGDGFGDPDAPTAACEAPDGTVADATDCDDADAGVNPAAVETCDGRDQDCDGAVDEDAVDAPTWYADEDGDGYGDAASPTAACDAPEGALADATDCDDRNRYIHPGRAEECDGRDGDCDGTIDEDPINGTTWYPDADGDGFGDTTGGVDACLPIPGWLLDSSDCDDADSTINPDGQEVCGGVDEDCDGLSDDDDSDLDLSTGSPWYPDMDGDGYGARVPRLACLQPSGTVTDHTDCDDTDSAINPDGTEVCDGADNDCDGDDDGADAVDALTWYADDDGDGYGDPAQIELACDQPSDAVADATDCDDATYDNHPGADELCDGVDNDCDGLVDAGDSHLLSPWYTDADGDGFGDATSTTWSCEQPAGTVGDATDCDDTNAAINPDAEEICDAVDDDCTGVAGCEESLADADAVLYGEAAVDYAGHSVAVLGDVDGDGIGDLGIGTYLRGASGIMRGTFWVASGPFGGEASLASATAFAAGDGDYDELGYALAPAGDDNADGYDDFWVSARLETDAAYRAGAVYLFDGPVSGEVALTDARVTIRGTSYLAVCGESLATEFDADADGRADLLVGCLDEDSYTGAAYLFLDTSSLSGSMTTDDADAALTGEDSPAMTGSAVAAGDLDGDGLDDLVVGADNLDTADTNEGAAYVVLSPAASMVLSDADGRFTGNGSRQYLGVAVAIPGDLDGDGLGDLLISEIYGQENAGAIWIVPGPATGDSEVASAATGVLAGAAGTVDYFGRSLACPGDVDGDGELDLVVGAHREAASSGLAGAVFLFPGPIAGTLGPDDAVHTWTGETAWDEAGGALAVGDLDGDGAAELVIGAEERSHVQTNDGAVYVVGL